MQRIVNRLQKHVRLAREDRRDHVHQLRHIRNLHNVRVIDEGIQEGGNHQRILQVVVLLQNAPPAFLVAARAIPDVPLIPGDIQLALRQVRQAPRE